MSVRLTDYTTIDWHSLFLYDETSPSGLRWKVKPHKNSSMSIGSIAGYKSRKNNPYWRVKIGNKQYFAHNIIHIMHGNVLLDGHIVDHIDGNGCNNVISNLRLILRKYNNHNQKVSKLNTSGVPGVTYSNVSDSWHGMVRSSGRKYSKSFACKKYGNSNAKQMATDFVITKRLELNASGEAAFTDRHIGIDTSINSSSKQENTLDACFQQD